MRRPSLVVIFMTVFIDLIGFGIVMPLLPIYSEQFGARGAMIGLIIASFSVMQFIFSPVWGHLSDRVGRRPVLLISLGTGVISYAIFAVASMLTGPGGLWLLLGSRVLAGISGGNISVAQAYIADITPPEQRSAKMALVGIAFGLGFIFGPALGALSARAGLSAPGWVATGLCLANFILASLVLPESRQATSEPTAPRPRWGLWRHTLEQPQVGLLIVLFFLATFCFACYETTLALLANRLLHYDQVHVGFLFAFSGVISVLVQAGLIRWLVQRWGEARLIACSFVLLGISLGLLPHLAGLLAFLAGLAVLALGSSLNRPPIFGLLSILTLPTEQGATLGVAHSAGSLARIFGPIVAASLFDLEPGLPYVVAGGISLGAAWLAAKGLRQPPRSAAPPVAPAFD